MKLRQGSRSPAVRRPRWYVRRLARRPHGIRARGPWGPRTAKVEDAHRLDTHELWERASIGDWGVRHIQVGGQVLMLQQGARYFTTNKHQIVVDCPSCGVRSRYLYLANDNPVPRCRGCCGLIYRSQARSMVTRVRAQIERLVQDGLSGKPGYRARASAYWIGHWYRGIVHGRIRAERGREERYRRWAQADAQSAAWELQQRQEREAARERERAYRRHIRGVWRAYIDSLSSRRLEDYAREFRKHTRWLARCGLPEDDPRRQGVVRYLETLAPLLPDYPVEVLESDARASPEQCTGRCGRESPVTHHRRGGSALAMNPGLR